MLALYTFSTRRMSSEELTIYRCLRSDREVSSSKVHNECADIIARNPGVDFRPGLTGVEVYHEVHEDTNWDADYDNYPRSYLEKYQGRIGYIIVSVRLDLLRSADLDWDEDPRFYQPDYFSGDKKRNWYIAGKTAVVRVRVERVIDVVPLVENQDD